MTVGNQQLAQQVFTYFKGDWMLQRFKDHEQIAFASASFSPLSNNDLLFYSEEGTNIQNNFNFFRQYEYRLEQNLINVFFVNQENKLFHTLDFALNPQGLLVADAVHHCVEDVYQVNYTIYSPDKLTISYKVSGPKKDYTLSTNYQLIKT